MMNKAWSTMEKADLRVYQMGCLIELIRNANLTHVSETETLHGVGMVMEELLGDIRIAIDGQYHHR